jgi:hypothetical protein
MRTKTLLLSAAALLAAGIVSSQAQPVYSQNIVGYASLTAPSAYTMMTVPFQVGVSNGGNEIFGTNLPDQTLFLIWNAAAGKYITDVYDTGAGYNTPPYWFMSDDSTPTNIPTFTPGQGFFMNAPGGVTNTFAGVVPVSVGATNTQVLGSFYNFIGSTIPFAGSVTNTTINLGGTNSLGATLPDQTLVLFYNSTSGKFVTDVYDTGAGYNTPPYWYMSDDSTPTNPPSISVGQGFFINPPGGGTWTEVLPSN